MVKRNKQVDLEVEEFLETEVYYIVKILLSFKEKITDSVF